MQILIHQLLSKRYLLAVLTIALGAAVTFGMTKSSIKVLRTNSGSRLPSRN